MTTSLKFDLIASTCAAASYVGGLGDNPLAKGIQFFALASLVDRVARSVFLGGEAVRQNEPPLLNRISAILIEEAAYSGVLLSERKLFLIFRIIAAIILGMGAAQTLIGTRIPPANQTGFTPDVKIAFVWAIAREVFLRTLPTHLSQPSLVIADSIVFALNEVGPAQKPPPWGSNAWYYKVFSSFCFRATANTAALSGGWFASLTQHALFNFSRSLP